MPKKAKKKQSKSTSNIACDLIIIDVSNTKLFKHQHFYVDLINKYFMIRKKFYIDERF